MWVWDFCCCLEIGIFKSHLKKNVMKEIRKKVKTEDEVHKIETTENCQYFCIAMSFSPHKVSLSPDRLWLLLQPHTVQFPSVEVKMMIME